MNDFPNASLPSTRSRGNRRHDGFPVRSFAAVLLVAAVWLTAGCSLDSLDIPTDPAEIDRELVTTAQHGTHTRLRALIRAGGDVNQAGVQGWTPLHFAVNRFRKQDFDDVRSLEVLLEAPGIDVQARTKDGTSAIQLAAQHGSIEALELLLANGADLELRKGDSFSPLASALRDRRADMAAHLLEKGVDANEMLPGGGNALFIAIRSRDPQLVKMLLDAGVNVHGGGKVPPIIFAAALRSEEVVSLLLEAGADVNAVNPNNGLTPLHRAVTSGAGMVKRLLDAGADPTVKDAEGHTPLDLARELGDEITIGLLAADSSPVVR